MKRDKDSIIGNRIKELRQDKKWSVAKLAEYTGLSASAISNYEYGFRKPDASALAAFERIFGVSGDYILGNTDESSPIFIWDDPEICEEVRENIPTLLRNIAHQIAKSTPMGQKMTFDILVELFHVLNIQDTERQESALSLLQSSFSSATRFVDVCNATNTSHETERERVDTVKSDVIATYTEALSTLQNSLIK